MPRYIVTYETGITNEAEHRSLRGPNKDFALRPTRGKLEIYESSIVEADRLARIKLVNSEHAEHTAHITDTQQTQHNNSVRIIGIEEARFAPGENMSDEDIAQILIEHGNYVPSEYPKDLMFDQEGTFNELLLITNALVSAEIIPGLSVSVERDSEFCSDDRLTVFVYDEARRIYLSDRCDMQDMMIAHKGVERAFALIEGQPQPEDSPIMGWSGIIYLTRNILKFVNDRNLA